MYTLYYMPNACSLATQVVIRELGQPLELINMQQVDYFSAINPVATVPVLVENTHVHREGAAIILHLLDKHPSVMLPAVGVQRDKAVQDIMFANATVHPAYSRLFFIAQHISDPVAQQSAFAAAAETITHLWQVVEQQLTEQDFLGGEQPAAADIMLAVYSRWGASFPVDLPLGDNTRAMLETVQAMPNFQRALAAEQLHAAA